mmetsp:Transcript_4591/g.11793  ORF Transcript_4591/g.11793 Transcript_4591/m.11793 type:complete len:263 (+) Transcript_4591:48-836(+)
MMISRLFSSVRSSVARQGHPLALPRGSHGDALPLDAHVVLVRAVRQLPAVHAARAGLEHGPAPLLGLLSQVLPAQTRLGEPPGPAPDDPAAPVQEVQVLVQALPARGVGRVGQVALGDILGLACRTARTPVVHVLVARISVRGGVRGRTDQGSRLSCASRRGLGRRLREGAAAKTASRHGTGPGPTGYRTRAEAARGPPTWRLLRYEGFHLSFTGKAAFEIIIPVSGVKNLVEVDRFEFELESFLIAPSAETRRDQAGHPAW